MKETPTMSRKQAQFFAGIIIICTVVAALILVIDYQIKGAIIEQANGLRKVIEDYYGQKSKTAGRNRPADNLDNDVAYPSDLVPGRDAGLEETGTYSPGNRSGKATIARTARPSDANGNGKIPGASE